MVCPCIIAPYFMLGPLTYLYTYFSNNVNVLMLLVLVSIALIYIYTHPELIKNTFSAPKNIRNNDKNVITDYNQIY